MIEIETYEVTMILPPIESILTYDQAIELSPVMGGITVGTTHDRPAISIMGCTGVAMAAIELPAQDSWRRLAEAANNRY